MASEGALLEAISVGRRRRRLLRDNFEQSNAPEAVTESEHNSVHDSLNGGVDESETKRPRLESSGDNVDGSAPQNGQLEEEKKEDETLDVQFLECLEPVKATAETTTEEPASNDNEKTDLGSAEEPEQPNGESEKELSNITREDSAEGQTGSDTQILSRKMEIPDDMADAGGSPSLVARGFSTDQAASASEQREVSFEKGGVRIGKARYTIQCLLDNTFAKIQIVSDADKVELFRTLESIKWAERLIQDVIAKADAGGSPSLVAQGFSSDQAASAGEQREVSVEKADAGGSPKHVARVFSTDQAASAGEQHEVSVEKDDVGGSPSLVARGFSTDQAASASEQREVSFEKGGVQIGKARNTIQCLLDNTFAKIQILSDADKVELFGTLENIKWSERLIKDVIAKADADGSPSLVDQVFSSDQAASVGEQREVSVEKADAGGSPKLVARVFSTDQAVSAGEQREVSVEKADAGGSPKLDAPVFHTDQAANVGEQRVFRYKKNELLIAHLRKGEPPMPERVCRVDEYARHFLGIDEHGDYYVSEDPEEIPPEYCIEQVERELFGLRKFRVQKIGESTYDIVMVGYLNIYKYNAWIAGGTLTFEEPDYASDTRIYIYPLALTFPTNMTVDEYKRKHMGSYKKMLKNRLMKAMTKAGLEPADYGVDNDLCLSLVGDLGPRKVNLEADDYPCEYCGGGGCTCELESDEGY